MRAVCWQYCQMASHTAYRDSAAYFKAALFYYLIIVGTLLYAVIGMALSFCNNKTRHVLINVTRSKEMEYEKNNFYFALCSYFMKMPQHGIRLSGIWL